MRARIENSKHPNDSDIQIAIFNAIYFIVSWTLRKGDWCDCNSVNTDTLPTMTHQHISAIIIVIILSIALSLSPSVFHLRFFFFSFLVASFRSFASHESLILWFKIAFSLRHTQQSIDLMCVIFVIESQWRRTKRKRERGRGIKFHWVCSFIHRCESKSLTENLTR